MLQGDNPSVLLKDQRRDEMGERHLRNQFGRRGIYQERQAWFPLDERPVGHIILQCNLIAELPLKSGDFQKGVG